MVVFSSRVCVCFDDPDQVEGEGGGRVGAQRRHHRAGHHVTIKKEA